MKRQDVGPKFHEPVLKSEVIDALRLPAHLNKKSPKSINRKIIDATVGLGGHSVELVKRGVYVLGIDTDEEMLKIADENLRQACPTPYLPGKECYTLVHASFADIDSVSATQGITEVDGIIFDLGVSSPQLTSSVRGFSFRNRNAELDMRLDPTSQGVNGADLLNSLRRDQLESLFNRVLIPPISRKLSSEIVSVRAQKPFKTVGDFLDVIEKYITKKGGLHVATMPFLALRIAVNSEVQNLNEALPKALELIKVNGKLIVISFHSGEDEAVKEFFKESEVQGRAKIITKKPITPSQSEISMNKRSRSAKLRILEKI